jgi:O-antigen/teichoic acid export membrane protein
VPLLFLTAMAASNLLVGSAARRWFGHWILPTRPDGAELRRRWREALPIGTANVVLRVLLNVDLLVLGLLATPEAAGHYAAAARVIFLLVVAVEVLWSALLPRQARLAAREPEAFRRTFNLYFGCLVAVLLPVAVGGRGLSAELIDLLYGSQYAEAAPVFANLAVSYSLLAMAMYLGNSLVASDRQRDYVRPLALAATAAAAATAVLVPSRGAVGASLGMLAGHTLLAATLSLVTRRHFDRSVGLLVAALLPGLAVMALVVARTPAWSPLLRVATGAATYLAAAALPVRWFVRLHRPGPAVAEGGMP